ncbi:Down syndrome cell adhesion molecule Dscam2, partial [Paramuricea clavata]
MKVLSYTLISFFLALLPYKPTNLTVTSIKSRSAEISWLDPENRADKVLSKFWIKMKKENSLILNTATDKVNKYKLDNLTPYTTYEISVAAGNQNGFGKGIITSFLTSEESPSGPPLNIKTTSRSASPLSFTWDPPEKDKQNGFIISYTACVSYSANDPCFQTFITIIKEGSNAYSGSIGFFTNGRAAKKTTEVTSSTLTYSLQIPSKTFVYFYVVALKLKDGKEPTSSDSYENNELVTYAKARKSTNPKPYIAAVVASSEVDGNMFILGDSRNTSDPTSRRGRSTSSDYYYNGPLEPGSSYSIFQRIVLNDKKFDIDTDAKHSSPRVLTKISSGDIKTKEGDLVNLLCSDQGEPPITFGWEKERKSLKSFTETEKPHRSSFLVVTEIDETSFGEYICHIRDRFESTTRTISVQKDT